MIINTGDNIYNPDGLLGADNSVYEAYCAITDMNKEKDARVKWCGNICETDFKRKFEYSKDGWNMDDFFWVHK